MDNDEEDDSDETLAFKSILRYKAEQTKILKEENETIQDHVKAQFAEELSKETEQFQRTLDFVKHQITLKDQRIDDLLLMNKELTLTNNKLVQQLMECPLRKEC